MPHTLRPPPTARSDKTTIYECGICDCFHPWDWNGDCREDDNRFAADEYAARIGVPESELDIRTWDERIEADNEGNPA